MAENNEKKKLNSEEVWNAACRKPKENNKGCIHQYHSYIDKDGVIKHASGEICQQEPDNKEEIGWFVRDICDRTYNVKSEVRSRLQDLLSKAKKEGVKYIGGIDWSVDYLEKTKKEAIEQTKKELLDFLLKNGHGGGNWRRLINQLKDKSNFNKE